jgi:SpoVK/Ycf46/Vps4 family AAA+-type ATPase
MLGFEDIADKYYGETPRKLGTVLDAVSAYAAAAGDREIVLFVDEADAMLSSRAASVAAISSPSNITDDRLVSQFLKFVDGVHDRDGVTIVLATNRLAVLDAAVMSRASDIIRVVAPDRAALEAMWQRNARHLPRQSHERLAVASAGLCGRDVARVCDSVERAWVSRAAAPGEDGSTPGEADYAIEVEARKASLDVLPAADRDAADRV